ncbi:MAG: ATP-binding protein, partial [Moraxella sp.]|nr:ATP-binding protein [Moraxella sp.]
MIDTSKFLLNADLLKHRTDHQTLPKTTKDCLPFDFAFGQHRAVKAINTALAIPTNGYHVFAVGENGLGKRTIVTHLLKERAKTEPTPNDLVYVYNFTDPRHPIALSLSAGMGATFAKDMHKLWHTLHKKLTAKFNSLGYQNQLNNIKQHAQKTEMQLMDSVNEIAKTHNLSLLQTQEQKAIFSPIDENIPVNQEAINKLQKELNKINVTLDDLEDKINEQIDELHETIAIKISEPLFNPLIKKYPNKTLQNYLKNYQQDICDNILAIIDNDEEFLSSSLNNVPSRYFVNVLISHDKDMGAPIVFEDMPTHPNLLGHIEYITQLGTIFTDASMIRAGALHRANGGYLLLEASSLLEHPYAWQGLKRALQSKQIKISSLEQMLTLTGSVSLEPDSVELSVKVILLGEPDLYYELLEFEPEFNAVFKIRADFHDTIIRNTDNEILLMSKIGDMAKGMNLLPFDNTACAAILDELSRLADNKNKLALHSDRLGQILAESSRHARVDNKRIVNKNHISAALTDMIERKSYLQELYWQEIENGQQLINTKGKAVGQINALTVISYAD